MRVSHARVEETRAHLLDVAPEGFEEVEVGAAVEFAVYTDAAGEERLRRAFGGARARAVDPDWEEAWKRFHRPIRVGPLWIGPPWERPEDDSIAVVIDPGRAFGTGAHPTTRLCLELLLTCARASLVDLGCGSGVLAIAAAKLGFEPVYALDVEAAAVAATRGNAEANGVRVDVSQADVVSEPLPAAEIAVANLAPEPVGAIAGRVEAATLVSSGYLVGDHPRPPRWRRVARREAEGWAADLFRRRRRVARPREDHEDVGSAISERSSP